MTKIAIIDYGMGNIKSISNMLRKIGEPSRVVMDSTHLDDISKIIIPGVGSFDNAMINLQQRGLIDALQDLVLRRKVPVLGICLGMQLFAKRSDEGQLLGLGWIDGSVRKLGVKSSESKQNNLKIPHMGWNSVSPSGVNTSLFENISASMRFYFVHTYHFVCEKQENVLATTTYGDDFTCAVRKGNIYGVQFHPEKSHKYGMQLLRNFLELPNATV